MSEYVLDSSAVLALLRRERSDVNLIEIVPSSIIGLINYSEVVDRFAREGNDRDWIENALSMLQLAIVVPDVGLATEAAMLRPQTEVYGLSLGDRFCLALALELQLPLVTTDQRLAEAAEAIGAAVILARHR
jgi:ribonuclease VapC